MPRYSVDIRVLEEDSEGRTHDLFRFEMQGEGADANDALARLIEHLQVAKAMRGGETWEVKDAD